MWIVAFTALCRRSGAGPRHVHTPPCMLLITSHPEIWTRTSPKRACPFPSLHISRAYRNSVETTLMKEHLDAAKLANHAARPASSQSQRPASATPSCLRASARPFRGNGNATRGRARGTRGQLMRARCSAARHLTIHGPSTLSARAASRLRRCLLARRPALFACFGRGGDARAAPRAPTSSPEMLTRPETLSLSTRKTSPRPRAYDSESACSPARGPQTRRRLRGARRIICRLARLLQLRRWRRTPTMTVTVGLDPP